MLDLPSNGERVLGRQDCLCIVSSPFKCFQMCWTIKLNFVDQFLMRSVRRKYSTLCRIWLFRNISRKWTIFRVKFDQISPINTTQNYRLSLCHPAGSLNGHAIRWIWRAILFENLWSINISHGRILIILNQAQYQVRFTLWQTDIWAKEHNPALY